MESNQIGADGEGGKQTQMLSQATIKMTFSLPAAPIFAKTMFTRSLLLDPRSTRAFRHNFSDQEISQGDLSVYLLGGFNI